MRLGLSQLFLEERSIFTVQADSAGNLSLQLGHSSGGRATLFFDRFLERRNLGAFGFFHERERDPAHQTKDCRRCEKTSRDVLPLLAFVKDASGHDFSFERVAHRNERQTLLVLSKDLLLSGFGLFARPQAFLKQAQFELFGALLLHHAAFPFLGLNGLGEALSFTLLPPPLFFPAFFFDAGGLVGQEFVETFDEGRAVDVLPRDLFELQAIGGVALVLR